MSASFTIRGERPDDLAEIHRITAAAFEDHPHSDQTEPFIVRGLRDAGALTVSLVGEVAGGVVGHVAVSPVDIADGAQGWFGLGPISVAPVHQGRGYGSALVRAALDALRDLGAIGCVLLGDPAFYGRFGFVADPALRFPGAPPELFQSLRLRGPAARGEVTYHAAFSTPPAPVVRPATDGIE